MLILIAESKTMTPCDGTVATEDYRCHRPASDTEAGAIMEMVQSIAPDELAARTKLSAQMVRRLQQMAYEFPNKMLGEEAIKAFTGVVFKAFSYPTLTPPQQDATCGRVRIISSLYGWLCPDDIIKGYRFDFTTPLAPGGMRLAQYWRNDVTSKLIEDIEATGSREVLDLLPADAARSIDWKEVARHARICKVGFREIVDGTTARTPNAGRLKTLRGLLLRQMIQEDVTTTDELLTLSSDSYLPAIDQSAGTIIFETV